MQKLAKGGVVMHLTQKERLLLEDQKVQEELCIKKYGEAAEKASDPELKQLFTTYQQQERQHLQTIQQILNGEAPQVQQQGQQQASQQQQQNQGTSMQMQGQGGSNVTGLASKQDADICIDLLSTEKYVSSTYNATIFECSDPQIRQALNHIQKEEQQHGEGIFNYMRQHGMYRPE
jgi:rubrerythrin